MVGTIGKLSDQFDKDKKIVAKRVHLSNVDGNYPLKIVPDFAHAISALKQIASQFPLQIEYAFDPLYKVKADDQSGYILFDLKAGMKSPSKLVNEENQQIGMNQFDYIFGIDDLVLVSFMVYPHGDSRNASDNKGFASLIKELKLIKRIMSTKSCMIQQRRQNTLNSRQASRSI